MDSADKLRPLVVVRILTYNHEKFIAHCLDTVLAQKTTFPFQLIVGEDCSTDNTRQILLRYQQQYPKQIVLLLNPVNNLIVNSMNNFKACVESGAKYVALLEGDDYWTDDSKLQRQFDFMEAHPDFTGCFHDGTKVDEDGKLLAESLVKIKHHLTTTEVIQTGAIYPTASLLFKTDCISTFPEELKKIHGADRWISIYLTLRGKLGYIDRNMCAYRIHGTGIYTSASLIKKYERQLGDFKLLQTLSVMKSFKKEIDHKISEHLSTLSSLYRENGQFKSYINTAFRYFRYMSFSAYDIKRLISHVLFPAAYKYFKGSKSSPQVS